jgi:predicted RNA binding protein YcfA (HicA-like mRNA interferase family)
MAMRGKRVPHASWDNDVDVKVRDIVKQLEDDGWSVVRQRGSHRQFKHATKPGLVTVAGKPGDDVAPGTLNSIVKQAGLKP